MAVTDAPRIVTSRLEFDDSHTLERYLATGGYEGLRKAVSMTPDEVAAEVDAISLLGRGGAGFPAGRKWSMRRKAATTYLVVNGDESEPATFKDHLLVERDPHQLVEGVAICAYAIGATQVFIYLRGEFALGLERVHGCRERGLRPRRARERHLRVAVFGRRRRPPRCRRLHLRRGNRAAREPRGQAWLPPDQAARTFPPRSACTASPPW